MADPVARLLPWSSPDGNPCFVIGSGYVSRVADTVEEEQLASAVDLIAEARCVLAGRGWTSGELQLLTVELTEALMAVHRVAVSRGARLVCADVQSSQREASPAT
ncbi:hypothetical protein GCM10012285_22670 [Streptomyces kronopolitis]|uniref:Uncharacterized protein n=1 Tax=Streptomyces kronopolitis TaxID=1612435 RepID=A0ABQ2JC68_9ACTN|nr:hypothetical protein [Streptomyces kronopolitis]GGN42372.1 hypothetical protein GCM10012285_22670 [Streptomyces kronopolitis]